MSSLTQTRTFNASRDLRGGIIITKRRSGETATIEPGEHCKSFLGSLRDIKVKHGDAGKARRTALNELMSRYHRFHNNGT